MEFLVSTCGLEISSIYLCDAFVCLMLQPFCNSFFHPCSGMSPFHFAKMMVWCITFALWIVLLSEAQKLGPFNFDDKKKDEKDKGKSF